MNFEQIWMFAVALVVFGVVIFIHELGHFLVAKLCRVGVIEFAIGFGRKIWKKRWGETRYAIGLIPLGGYVRMVGDDPYEAFSLRDGAAAVGRTSGEALAPVPQAEAERPIDQVEERLRADRRRWFLEKPVPSKMAIVLAGPGFNFLFGFVLSVLAFCIYGKPSEAKLPVIGELFPDYPAVKAGFQSGDFVRRIDGRIVASWEELSKTVRESEGREMAFEIERTDPDTGLQSTHEIKVAGTADTGELSLLEDAGGPRKRLAFKIGITPKTGREPVSFSEAVKYGGYHVWYICRLTGRVLYAMVRGAISPSKVVGGPIAVFAGAAKSAKQGFEALLDFIVLLSVSLGLFNLFPIPILDGGHLVFFAIEGVKGSPVGVRWLALANQIGMVILVLLMAFAVSNDVMRLL